MIFLGNGIVWDRENNKPLVEFENGEVETKDKRTIKILKDLEFKTAGKVEDEEPPTPSIDPQI